MSRYLRAPSSGPEWGVLMIALMLLFSAIRLLVENSLPTEAVGLGVYQGGITAILLMLIYVFWRGIQSVATD